MNIIGDVAGRHDELMQLLNIMPPGETYLLGDIVDRGPKSRQVVEWAMQTPDVFCIKGNHEDMMVDACTLPFGYSDGIWLMNGGVTTLVSYGWENHSDVPAGVALVPKEHIEWLNSRPLYMEFDDLILSHAPISWDEGSWRLLAGRGPTQFMWNRGPAKQKPKFQVYGHNGRLHWSGKEPPYAVCVDNSSRRELCGLHWPSKNLFSVEYIDRR